MTSTIILIGPMSTGKSTLGKLLSEKLGVPQVPIDTVKFRYYAEIGYDVPAALAMRDESFAKLYQYWKPFEAYAVERVLAEHSDCVIDFGAGLSVFEDDALFARVQRALLLYPNVVLILPSPDLDESVRILKERAGELVDNGIDFVEHFVRHHSNHDLAKIAVYTKDKTPEETRDEILRMVS